MALVPARIIVVMGVASSGKTVTGKSIARRLHAPFLDGDDFHPPANKDKMRAGIPLVDEDRWPWLQALAQALHTAAEPKGVSVGACSALKRAYRDVLVHGRDDVRIVFLDGTQDLIAARLAARKGHFMPPGLLASQFKTLERPGANERPIMISIDAPVERIVDDIVTQLNLVPQ